MLEMVTKYDKYYICTFCIWYSSSNLEMTVWNHKILKDNIVTMVKLFQDLADAGDIEIHKIALGDLLH